MLLVARTGVETAHLRNGFDCAAIGLLYRPRLRSILFE
jgi:hypothetical protein